MELYSRNSDGILEGRARAASVPKSHSTSLTQFEEQEDALSCKNKNEGPTQNYLTAADVSHSLEMSFGAMEEILTTS